MNTNTDPVRALAERLFEALDDAVTATIKSGGEFKPHAIRALQAALASAPPSAPVGVEAAAWALVRECEAADVAGDLGDVDGDTVNRLRKALAQQPAAPEGCGACGDGCANRSGGCRLAEENPPAAPSGEAVGAWVTVPREPTDAMLDAMHGRIRILCNPAERTADIQNDAEVWGAMLAAAPQQPAGVDEAMVRASADVVLASTGETRESVGETSYEWVCEVQRAALTAALAAQQQGGAE